jgi:N-acetylglucosamine kinase-like BadF-type ATPase
MLLIADSGSTKCDWILYKNEKEAPVRIRTKGLNPVILSKKALKEIIINSLELTNYKDLVTSIHFFGAGCGTEKNKCKIDVVLTSFFKNAIATTEEDIMAAVYATTIEPAVVCIIGTGSNCCYYNGNIIEVKTPALGYLLMDEASGNYFGKELIKAYYYGKMPEELEFLFKKQFNLKEKSLIRKLYHSSTPNKYLAEFARFLFENEEYPFIKKLLIEGITKFVENHVLQYKEELKKVPLHFVGSIAYHAKDYIEEVLNKKGLKAASFIRRPIDNLANHLKIKSL